MNLQQIREVVAKAVCTNAGVPYDEGGAAALKSIDNLIEGEKAREIFDAQAFPPIPETNQMGEKLNSAYFVKLSNTNLSLFKNFIRKHGAAQVTRALRERI